MKLKVVQKKPVFISIIFYAMIARKKKKKKVARLMAFSAVLTFLWLRCFTFLLSYLKKKITQTTQYVC